MSQSPATESGFVLPGSLQKKPQLENHVNLYSYHHLCRYSGLASVHLRRNAPSETFEGLFKHLQIGLGAQLTSSWVVDAMAYHVPMVIIIAAYPFLLARKRKKMNRAIQNNRDVNGSEIGNGITLRPEFRTSRFMHSPVLSRKSSDTSSLILTNMTISTVVCWTPWMVAEYIDTFLGVKTPLILWNILSLLYQLQTILDPILFAVTLTDVRALVRSYFRLLKIRKDVPCGSWLIK